MKQCILTFLVAACCCQWSTAQESRKTGTTAAQFLKIGVGARSMSMAGAMAGAVNDASALYWNPSAMTSLDKMSLLVSHTRWFADITHQYVGFCVPLGEANRLGFSATLLTMDKIEITTEQNPRGTGNFYQASDIAIGASYAIQMVDFFSFGVSMKYIIQTIYNESASAIAFDFGTTLKTGFNGIIVGMNYSNFGTAMKLDGRDLRRTYDPNPNNATNVGVSSMLATESWELPVNFKVGIGWHVIGGQEAMMQDETNKITVGIDAAHPNDGIENAVIGAEYVFQDFLALRGGYYLNDDVRSFSYGAGVNWNRSKGMGIGVEYAFAAMDHLGQIHTISLIMTF
jgi:hypothetical protein